jgi:hypothetical protein
MQPEPQRSAAPSLAPNLMFRIKNVTEVKITQAFIKNYCFLFCF